MITKCGNTYLEKKGWKKIRDNNRKVIKMNEEEILLEGKYYQK